MKKNMSWSKHKPKNTLLSLQPLIFMQPSRPWGEPCNYGQVRTISSEKASHH